MIVKYAQVKILPAFILLLFFQLNIHGQSFNSRISGAWNSAGTWITAADLPFTIGTSGISTTVACSGNPSLYVSAGDILVTSSDVQFGINSTVTAVSATTITINTASNIVAGSTCRVRRVPTVGADVNILNNITAPVSTVNINSLIINTGGSLIIGATNFTVTGTTQNSGSFTDNSNTGITTFGGSFTNNNSASFSGTAVTTSVNMNFSGGIINNTGATAFTAGAATIGNGSIIYTNIALSFSNAVSGSGALTVAGTGVVTLSGGNSNIAGNLNINSGSGLLVSTTGTFTVGGSFQNDGSFTDNNNTAGTSFTSLVTNTGSFVTSSVTTTGNMIFNGGLTYTSGTFTVPTATFATGNTITATSALNFTAPIATTGAGTLIISGAGGTTLSGGNSNITGNLSINTGSSLTVSTTGTFGVTGTTLNNGNFIDSDNTSATTFTGLITNNGNFNTAAVTTINRMNFNGGLTHTGGVLNVVAVTLGSGQTITADAAVAIGGLFSGSGAVTIAGTAGVSLPAGNCTIAGNLTVNSGASLLVSTPGTFSVGGTVQNDGTFTDNNNAAITTFTGLVTSTGNFNATGVTTTANMVFNGGLTYNAGTMALPTATFATGKTIYAALPLNFTGAIATSGALTLTISGPGGMAISGTSSSLITGNLAITSGASLSVSTTGTFGVSGTTLNDGTFTDNDNTSATTFTGLVTNTGTFTTTAITTTNRLLFNGGLTHTSGTLNVPTATFATGQAITATSPVNFTGSVSAPGSFSISGAGGVTLSGTASSSVTGTLTVNAGAAITLNTTGILSVTGASFINGNLGLNNGILNNGTANVTFGALAAVTGAPSASSMILTTGNVLKLLDAPGSFTFPVGTGIKYTPLVMNLTAAAFGGAAGSRSIGVKTLATVAPAQLDASYSLTKYWTTSSVNLSAMDASLIFSFDNSEANASAKPTYVGGEYNTSWSTNGTVNGSLNTISFTKTAASDLNSNWTAGPVSAFSAGTFYSRTTGNWETPSTWSTTGPGGAPSSVSPTNGSAVIVGNGNTVSMTTSSAKNMASIQIDATGILDMGVQTGLSAGTLTGSGALKLSAAGASAIFPTITTNNFLTTSGSTVEYYGATAFNLPVTPSSYQNLTISGSSVKTLQSSTVAGGNLSIVGGTMQLGVQNFNVKGTTNIAGILNDNSATGNNLFEDNVQVSATGIWTTTNNPSFTFRKGIANYGNMSATGTGVYTFNTFNQAVSGNAPITFNGPVVVSGGITLTNQNTNVVTINNTLDGDHALSSWLNDNGSNLYYGGVTMPFNTLGTLDATAVGNTVNYLLNGAQPVKGITYYNLTVSIGNTKTLQGNINVSGVLNVAAGTLELAANNITVLGNTLLTGILNDNNVAGNNSFQNVTMTGGTINSNPTSTFTIAGLLDVTSGNGNLGQGDVIVGGVTTIGTGRILNLTNAAGNKTFTGNVTVNGTWNVSAAMVNVSMGGNLTVNSGATFTSNTGLYTFSGSGATIDGSVPNLSITNIATMAALTNQAAILNIATLNIPTAATFTNGTSNIVNISTALSGAGNYTQSNNSTLGITSATGVSVASFTATATGNVVNYNANAVQPVRQGNYYHLTVSVGNTKTLAGDINVGGDLTVSAGTMDLGIAATNITIAGNALITGTLNYNGTTTKAISVNGNLSGTGNVNMSGGNLLHTLNLSGAVNSIGSLTTAPVPSIVNYSSTGDQVIFANSNYRVLTVSGGGTKSIQGVTVVNAGINVTGTATLSLNGNNLTSLATVSIAAASTMDVNSNATLMLGAGVSINNSGICRVVGTSGNIANVTRSGAGNYNVNQTAATAIFHARYYAFNYLGTSGITINNGTIDAVNNFSNGIISNGSGSQSLNLTGLNFSDFIASNVVFNTGPAYNISRTSGTGTISIQDASGTLSGENYDNDNGNPGTLIEWVNPSTTFYSQGNNLYSNLSNWNSSVGGGGFTPAPTDLTNGLSTFIIRDGHTVTLDQNIDLLSLTVGGGTSGTLIIGNDATGRVLTTRVNLKVKAGGDIHPSNIIATPASHTIDIRGNFTNAGNINLKTGLSTVADVVFNGLTTLVDGPSVTNFNNILFNIGSNVSANIAFNVQGNVTLATASLFQDGGFTHRVTGDWIDGTTGQMTGAGTIQFNTTSGQSIQSSSAFNNITFNGGGAVSLNGAVTALGNFYVTNNTDVVANTNVVHTVAKNYTVDAGSSLLQSTGYIDFNGTASAQSVDAGNSSFYNVNFTNGGASNPKNITGDLLVNNQLFILNSAVVNGSGSHTLASFRQEGTCNFAGQITFTSGTIFNNSAPAISLGTANILVTGNMFIQANNLVTTGGNVSINSGYLVINSGATLTGNSGIFSLNGNASLYIRGANNFPTGYSTYALAPGSYVRYDQNFPQVVRGNLTYGNLLLDYNTKTVDGPTDTYGNLNLGNSVTADFSGFNHAIKGNLNNSGTCIFINDRAVTLDSPDADQSIGNGTYTFNDLNFINSAPTVNPRTKYLNASSMVVNGNFTATNPGGSPTLLSVIELGGNSITGSAGAFNLGANVRLNTSGSNSFQTSMNSFTTKNLHVASTVRFYATTIDQYLPFTGISYGNLEIANTGNKIATGSLDINGNFLRVGGNIPVFVDGGFNHSIAGDMAMADIFYPSPSPGTTIIFDGATQNIGFANSNINFNNIVFAGTGIKTFANSTNGSAAVILGNLTINDGVNVDFNSKNIQISGNWINDGSGTGLFSQTATTTFLGTAANQSLSMASGSSFGNVTINKPTAGSQTLTATTDMAIAGNLTFVTSNADFNATGKTISIGGTFTYNPSTTFTNTSGTFNFNGNTAQSINNNQPLAVFNNLTFTGTGTKLLNSGPIQVNGNLNIIGASTFNGNNQVITVSGNWVNGGTFQHSATVNFNGGNQTISTSSFNNVAFGGTNTKTLSGNISLGGNLSLLPGATLDVTSANYAVSVAGSWSNTGNFLSNTGTVTFNGNAKTITTGGAGAGKSFYNVLFTMTSGQNVTLAGDMDVNNDFNITSGSFITSTFNILIGGNFYNNDIFNQNSNSSILTFKASGGTKAFNPGAGANVYRGITVNAPTATILLSNNNITLSNNQPLILQSGTFKLNGLSVTMTNGNITLAPGAVLDIDAGARLFLADNATINNSGGILKMVGTSGNYANILRNGGTAGQGYNITQTAGTIHAKFYQIQNTKGAGVTVSGGSIDGTNNFSNGIFTGGAGTQYLLLSGLNFTDFSASGVVFNAGPTYNITRLSGSGVITLNATTGSLAGPSYENDAPANYIRWTALGKRWTNLAADNNWDNPSNWSPAGIPTVSDTIYLDHTTIPLGTAYTVNVYTANANAYRLIIDKQGGTGSITLAISGGRNLNINETFNLLAGNVLTVANNTNLINVGGNWLNAGTFNTGNSTVNLTAASGNFTISPGLAGFYNLNIVNGGYYSLTGALTVGGNLGVTNGTLDVGTSNNITIAGNWNNSGSGVFIPGIATVTFNNTGPQTISGGPFYNFVTAGSGTKSIISSITVNQDMTISAGTVVDAGTNILSIARNWINNASTAAFTQSGGGTVILNGSTQSIDLGTQSTGFNNLTLAGAVNNTKTLFRNITVAGDLNISSSAAITFDINNFTITGTPAKSFILSSSGSLIVRGSNNFPSGFGTVSLASNSSVQYRADINQNIYGTNYGNLTLVTNTNVLHSATASGGLNIAGNLTVNDIYVQLNMNNNDIQLTGNLSFPPSGRQMLWGTGTFTHNGAGWNIDADITGFTPDFGNVVLAGTGIKAALANLNFGGDLIVQSGIGLNMQTYTMTAISSGKSFTLSNGATLYSNIPASTGSAFPTGFAAYSVNSGSTVILNGTADQTVFTGVNYGNLYLSNNVVNNTLSGILNVSGNFYTRSAALVDATYNMNLAGSIIDIRTYTPSSASTINLNGGAQNIYNGVNGAVLSLGNLIFSNSATKIIGSAPGLSNQVNIGGNVTIATGVTVSDSRNTNFAGSSWINNGTFNHTANTFTYNGVAGQNINAGVNNSYNAVAFNNTTGVVTFTNSGTTINNTFTINPSSTVNMGALTHSIAGDVINMGTWTTNTTNFNFTGGNQVINTPVFNALNIIISGNGTKFLGCDWNIGNLTINSGTTLSATAAPYNITLIGNWTNNGAFSHNGNKVAFESNNTVPKTITAGISSFNTVTFNQLQNNTRTYTLISPATAINNVLTIGNGAFIDLNSTTLTLGSANGTMEAHTVQAGGTLKVNANANLKFNNSDGNSSLNVAGTLITTGTSGNVATISRSNTTNRVDINVSGMIGAQYYYYEYLGDNGFIVQSTATVDATNNFSNGTWSNMNTAGGALKYYLILNASNPGNISNITFNFGGTPTIGVHFNVQRSGTATGTLTFADPVSGLMGSYRYESDPSDPSSPSATSGKCLWPLPLLVTWTGATSRDWNVSTNWNPGTVPTAIIDVVIPDVSNDPLIINAHAVCKNLTLTNGILGLDNGFSLTVNKDVVIGTGASAASLSIFNATSEILVAGAWTRGSNGLFAHGNSKVKFTGDAGAYTITPLTSPFYNVEFNGTSSNFYLTGTNINIAGNLNILSGTLFPNTAGYTINLAGNFNNLGKFSTVTNGTVNLNGGNQSLIYATVNTLIAGGTGIKTTLGSDTIYGNTTINAGATLTAGAGSTIDFRGNMTINTGGSFDDGNNAHNFYGATWTGNGIYTPGNGSVTFLRNGVQTINGGTFNNLIFSGNNAKLLGGNVRVNGSVSVSNTISYLNLVTYTLNSNNGTGTFSMEPGANLYIRGAGNAPFNFASYDLDPASNTYYDAAFDQIIGGFTYGNLNLQNVSVKTLADNINVSGNLNFNTATLDVSAANYGVNVNNSWNNNSTGSFIAHNGTVTLEGTTGNSIYNGTGGTKDFYNLIINKSAGQALSISRDVTVVHDLVVQSGIYNANGFVTTVGNNLTAQSGNFSTSGTFLLNLSGGTAYVQSNGSVLNNLQINGAGSTFILQDDLAVNGNFTLTTGTFDGNGKQAALGSGAKVVTIAGIYKVGAGGILSLGNTTSLSVVAGGILEVIGTTSNFATVTRTLAGGSYNFTVDGTIRASQYLIEYMNTSGIQINSSGTIDPTYNFSNGTFTNGVSGGTYLRIENSQTMTISNISFPFNPGGGAKNVSKISSSTGTLTFDLATGVFAGAAFENDPGNIINWTGPITLTWNGMVSTNWFTAGNWTATSGPSIVPTGAEDVVIANAGAAPVIDADGAITGKLTVKPGAMLTMNTPFAPLPDLTVNGDLLINGTIIMSGANDTLLVAGNWTKAATGTFNCGTGTVIFNASGAIKSINNGTSFFNHLVLNGPSTFQLGANTTLNGNFTGLQGTMDVTAFNYNLTVKGSWINNGLFNGRNASVNFVAGNTGNIILNPGTSPFNHLNLSGTSATSYQLTGTNLSVNGNTGITGVSLILNSKVFNVGDGIGSDNATLAGTLDVTANGTIKMGTAASLAVNTGGTLKIVGLNANNPATVSRQNAGNYSIIVNTGGSIQAQYYLLEYMNSSGVQLKAGATIHAINNFSNGIFSNGAAGGTYLVLENSFSDFTAQNIVFNNGPVYNVARLQGTGVINLQDATGALSGFLYENDDLSATTGKIVWTYTFPVATWTGNISSDWNDIANWDINMVPTLATNVTIPDVSATSNRSPVLNSGANGLVKNLTLLPSAAFTIGNSLSLTVSGSLTVNASGSLSVSPNSSSTIIVSNLWSVSGAFIHGGASTVVLDAAMGTKSITTGGNAFKNLTINGAATFQSLSSLAVAGNLQINAGVFQITSAAHQLNIGGNWNNTGTFLNGGGKVVFDKVSGIQQISGNNTFKNLTISTTGANVKSVLLANDVNIDGSVVISGNNCTFDAGGKIINLKGDWTNTGKPFACAGSTVNLVGNVQQNISRNPSELFNNITVNNTALSAPQVFIVRPTQLNGILKLTRGVVSSSNNLTINLNTGAIDPSGTGSISGDIIVARDVTTGWHYLSSPVTGAKYSDLNDNVVLTKTNFYFYKESSTHINKNVGWGTPMPAALSTTLAGVKYPGGPVSMNGYMIKFPSPTHIDIAGGYTHNSSFSTGNLSYTPSGTPASDGWHVIGNPYPSYINWNSVGITTTNITSSIAFYNQSLGQNAIYMKDMGMGETYLNGGSPFIPPMQAFWIQTTAPNASVSVTNAARTVTPNLATPYNAPSYYRKAAGEVKTLKLSVRTELSYDDAVIRFGNAASEDFDVAFDAFKWMNGEVSPSLYSTCNNQELAVNSLPKLIAEKVIPLSLKPATSGTHTISIREIANFESVNYIILEDKLAGTKQNLKVLQDYVFDARPTDMPDRFILHFSQGTVTNTSDFSVSVNALISSSENRINVNFSNYQSKTADVSVSDLFGREVYKSGLAIADSKLQISSKAFQNGIYMVKVIIDHQVFSGKVYLDK